MKKTVLEEKYHDVDESAIETVKFAEVDMES